MTSARPPRVPFASCQRGPHASRTKGTPGASVNVYVVGVATHPARSAIRDRRLEEMAAHTARAALKDAGVTRNDLDCVTARRPTNSTRGGSAACCWRPSGLSQGRASRHEFRNDGPRDGPLRCQRSLPSRAGHCVESSVGALAGSGDGDARGTVFIRPVGLNKAVADGLFTQVRYASVMGLRRGVIAARVHERSIAARRNPRSVACSPSWRTSPVPRTSRGRCARSNRPQSRMARSPWSSRHNAG